jgi:hypothetical protein
MIRLHITAAAYAAIRDALVSPDGLYEPHRSAQVGFFIWLRKVVSANQLFALRGRGEDVSDVTIRSASLEAAA